MDEKDLRRLSDCEVLINKYYQDIQKYIKQSENFIKDNLTKSEFHEFIFTLKSMFYKEIDFLDKKYADSVSQLKGLEKNHDDTKKLSNQCHESLQYVKHEIQNLFSNHEFLQHKHNDLSARLDSLNLRMPNRDKINQDYQQMRMFFSKLIEDLQKDQDALRQSQSHQAQDIRLSQGIISNNHDLNQKMLSDLKASNDDMINKLNLMRSDHKAISDNLKKYVDQKIEHIPKPPEPNIPDMQKKADDLKNEIINLFEKESNKYIKALDISLMNDLQIRSMTKKIDSILSILEKNKIH